jgi:hypothetical protein
MGSITRGLSNNITTGGVILPAGITNASVADVTSFANASGGTLILLSTQTASNSATISFTTGLNSTYDAYEFHFIDIHARSDGGFFEFNGSTDSGSNYNVTKTSAYWRATHNEPDTFTEVIYQGGEDLAQSTAYQKFSGETGSDADGNVAGTLTIYNPSSTTYAKHYISVMNSTYTPPYPSSLNSFVAGYCNTTSAVNAIQFRMSTGNFDGIIKLYGLKKS